MKDELVGTIMEELAALRAKKYSYLANENKKAKGTKKCIIERKLEFEDYEHCLDAT